jgi:hypothetical protein
MRSLGSLYGRPANTALISSFMRRILVSTWLRWSPAPEVLTSMPGELPSRACNALVGSAYIHTGLNPLDCNVLMCACIYLPSPPFVMEITGIDKVRPRGLLTLPIIFCWATYIMSAIISCCVICIFAPLCSCALFILRVSVVLPRTPGTSGPYMSKKMLHVYYGVGYIPHIIISY